MNTRKLIPTVLAILGVVTMATVASADIVETKNGARIVGKVTKIDGGKVYVTTDYAGDLTIKQSEVTGIVRTRIASSIVTDCSDFGSDGFPGTSEVVAREN